ncbi:hypothetical protein HDV05_002359 [Chytridiales sp. JEL 0842]|nr:hypothetical protein HDV05_002359 [Chytridiales sp. JEL 0842]
MAIDAASNDPNEFLSNMVLDRKETVTLKLLSRKLLIDIDTARKALSDFVGNEKVHATYVVSGVVPPTESEDDGLPCVKVVIVPAEKLEETKSRFTECSVNVYSVEPVPLTNFDVLANINLEVMKEDTWEAQQQCQKLQPPDLVFTPHELKRKNVSASRSSTSSVTTKSAAPSAKPPTSFFPPSKTASNATTPANNQTDNKNSRKPTGQTKAKGSFFENQIKKAAEKKERDQKVAEEKAKKIEKEKEKKRGEAAVAAIQHADVEAKLHSMFNDEDDEDDEKEAGGVIMNEDDDDDFETKKLRLMAKQAAGPATGDDDEEMSEAEENSAQVEPIVEDEISMKSQPSNDAEDDAEYEVRRVRRRRKVIRKETLMSGKYMGRHLIVTHIFKANESLIFPVTKDVEGWESYSEEERVPKAKVSRPTLPSAVVSKPEKMQTVAARNPPKEKETIDEPHEENNSKKNKKEIKEETSPSKAAAKGKGKGKKEAAAGQKTILSFFNKK